MFLMIRFRSANNEKEGGEVECCGVEGGEHDERNKMDQCLC